MFLWRELKSQKCENRVEFSKRVLNLRGEVRKDEGSIGSPTLWRDKEELSGGTARKSKEEDGYCFKEPG